MEEYKYLIPEESIDAIMNNVSTLRKIENDLRRVFVEHDYLEVLMPSFEYVDLYNALDSGIEEEKMFQYINFEGKRVALRTDFTIPLELRDIVILEMSIVKKNVIKEEAVSFFRLE